MPRGHEHTTPSPGATEQLWLQPPLFREHWSGGRDDGIGSGSGSQRRQTTALLGLTSGAVQTEPWHPARGILLFHSQPALCPTTSQAFSGPGLGPHHPPWGLPLPFPFPHHGCMSLGVLEIHSLFLYLLIWGEVQYGMSQLGSWHTLGSASPDGGPQQQFSGPVPTRLISHSSPFRNLMLCLAHRR